MADSTGREIVKNIGSWATTLFVFALVFWAMYYVFQDHGTRPEIEDGQVVLDKFGNAKDVLLVVLPLASAAVGYWFGNRGIAEANTNAQAAREDANAAQQQKEAAVKEQVAVVTTAAAKLPAGTDIVAEARQAHPEAFGMTR